jgi:hypothetical protein
MHVRKLNFVNNEIKKCSAVYILKLYYKIINARKSYLYFYKLKTRTSIVPL